MATTIADLPDMLKGIPSGAWVAISERKHAVVAYGPDAQEVLRDAEKNGENQPLLVRVPEQGATMLFF
jgi:hypothetical protein